MKKNFFLFVLMSIIAAFVLVRCGGQSSENDASETEGSETGETEAAGSESKSSETMEPVTLKLADFFPGTHPVHAEIFTGWAEDIKEATDGLVTVDLYPGGTLAGNGDIFPGVQSGIADIGHDIAGYNSGSLPILNAMYLGGVEYQNVEVASLVARDAVEQLDPQAFKETELMFTYGISPGVIMSNEPVRSLEDLEGMQIRASGTNVETLEALGATPVAMSVTETYEAMSRGVVDGILMPPEALKGFNLAELVDYVTHSSQIYNTVQYVTMNKDVWNSFPADVQEAIQQVNEETFGKMVNLFSQLNEDALEYAMNEHGVEEIHLSEEEQERWNERLAPLIDQHAEELSSEGLDGQKIMDTIVELSEKYNAEFGE